MDKTDFKKELKELYKPSSKGFSLIEVPEMQFLQINGYGDPNTAQSYKDAVEALYAVSYKLKFMSKKGLEKDYVVPPLEGLWWADDPADFTERRKDAWFWTMMIMQPQWITSDMVSEAIEVVRKKKELSALPLLQFEPYHEGLVAQILHIGSYNDEAPTLKLLHETFIPENSLIENGKHHEIYLSDPRKIVPKSLKQSYDNQ